MKPTLWTSTRTSGSIAHIVLGAAGLEAEVRFISLRAGDHRKPDYLALNPKGEVPALQLPGGEVITEIPAILFWIAEAAPEARLVPTDPTGRAKALEWLAWCHFRMADSFTLAFNAPRLVHGDEAATELVRRAAGRRSREALVFADAALAKQGGRLLGTPAPTAPDIFLTALADFAGFLGIDISELRRLAALQAEVAAIPGVAAALEREKALG